MSFDALLSIIFILFFVVGPLLRRFSGRGQSTRQPPQRRPQAGQEARPPREATAEGEGPLSRRLEEARRRVQEAMGDQVEPHLESKRSAADSRSTASTRELDWQASAKVVPAFLTPTARPASRRKADTAAESAALRKDRSRVRQPAKLRLGRRPALDDNGILNGVIWHEILSEPVSRRGTRRQPSRLRSR
ncbi:MAG: hypothetical protein WD314_12450 [Trueperaceae bacterium]